MAKKKTKTPRSRNWLAMHAKGLTGRRNGGAHPDRKKKANKDACRKKVRV